MDARPAYMQPNVCRENYPCNAAIPAYIHTSICIRTDIPMLPTKQGRDCMKRGPYLIPTDCQHPPSPTITSTTTTTTTNEGFKPVAEPTTTAP